MIKFSLRNLILFELLSTLLLSLGIGAALFLSDLSSFWRERFSMDAGVIRQAFLDHRNEILTGSTGSFESTLSTVANVYGIKFLEIDYKVTSRIVRLSRDPNERLAKSLDANSCRKPGLITLITGKMACFTTEFSWARHSGEPLLTVRWWVVPEGLERQKRAALLLFSSCLLLGLAFCGLHWILIRRVIVAPVSKAIARFDQWIRSETGDVSAPPSRFKFSTGEITDLVRHLDRLLVMAQDYRQMRDVAIQLEAIDLIARQVSHDLRSPLGALRIAVERMSKSPSPEAKQLAMSSFQRVHDILATLGRSAQAHPGLAPSISSPQSIRAEDMLSLVDAIVSEHQLLIDHRHARLVLYYEKDQEYFVRVDGVAIRRAISNLLNNAVESLCPGRPGEVSINLSVGDSEVQIAIEDNGVGIPSAILSHLGEKGLTHGKNGAGHVSGAGSGLGVHQAKNAIEACGGQLIYTSQPAQGTLVTIRLPRAETPNYWAKEIPFATQIVVVDDDLEVHRQWRAKFESLPVNLICFLSAIEFEDWVRDNPDHHDRVFLLDFSLGSHQPTGIELVERNRLPPTQTVIVTAIADQAEIQAQVERLGIRLLAKQMVSFKSVGAPLIQWPTPSRVL